MNEEANCQFSLLVASMIRRENIRDLRVRTLCGEALTAELRLCDLELEEMLTFAGWTADGFFAELERRTSARFVFWGPLASAFQRLPSHDAIDANPCWETIMSPQACRVRDAARQYGLRTKSKRARRYARIR